LRLITYNIELTGDLALDTAYQSLSALQLGIAGSLVLLCAAASLWLALGVERRMLISAARMVAQLLLVGFVLNWIFALDHPLGVGAVLASMTIIAGVAAGRRTEIGFQGMTRVGATAVTFGSWLASIMALFAVMRVRPWYTPQYAIPLVGMILGNTMNGVALGLERFAGDLASKRAVIESALALGATRWEATAPLIRASVQTGLIPTFNTMIAAGIVTLPGMMTGQILAGASPFDAAKYQMVIMFLMTFAVMGGTLAAAVLAARVLFTSEHQLNLARLVERGRRP